MTPRTLVAALAVAAVAFVTTACGANGDDTATSPTGAGGDSVDLRLGYFPNLTHAPALVGIEQGFFADALGAQVDLETIPFNAGPEAVDALFSGALDATFIGPNPAINAFARSNGEAVRIVAGTTSGGASLVVRRGIDRPEDLAGARLASPQLGGTQDVALRAWLAGEGYATDTGGGGAVSVLPQANADTLVAFRQGGIDGAWLPEPWATRLIEEGGGHVLVDEKDLWPGGRFVTTHLVVAPSFLRAHPDAVRDLINGLGRSIDLIAADPATAQRATNRAIAAATGAPLPPELLGASWSKLQFGLEPVLGSLEESAAAAERVGLLDPVDLEGIYALELLDEVLATRGDTRGDIKVVGL